MASSLGGKNPVPKGAVKDRVNFYESVSEDTRSSGSGGLRRSKSELTLHHNSDINNGTADNRWVINMLIYNLFAKRRKKRAVTQLHQ